jgi:DNA invertase Pin-like site-specific DNA recombinase
MNTEQQIKMMAEIQMLFAKMYRMEMSARIKQGLAKKSVDCKQK